jgi:hypothetical protein
MTSPPFCPNINCPNHDPETARSLVWFYRVGTFPTKARGAIHRFICKDCGKTCSTQTFSIHYWTHSTLDLENLDKRLCSCSGYRQIGRDLGLSYRVLRNRYLRVARGYLNLFDSTLASFPLAEDIAFDGFESYLRSQYFPNNFNIAVGSTSQVPYLFNLTLFRRKGAMTEKQKTRRAMIDTCWKPPRQALINHSRAAFREILTLYMNRGVLSPFTLHTDERTEYIIALKRLPEARHLMELGVFSHRQTSSRAARTRQNPLFPVNYLDREIRKNSAAHVRETVRADREANMAVTRMVILLGNHAFRKPYRIIGDKPRADAKTHAEKAGLIHLSDRRKQLDKLYSDRPLWSHQTMKAAWCRRVWQMREENPPIVDFTSGAVTVKGQPGRFYRAAHLVA